MDKKELLSVAKVGAECLSRKYAQMVVEIDAMLLGETKPIKKVKLKAVKKRRPMSPESRARIVAAQKARWKAYHAKHAKKVA